MGTVKLLSPPSGQWRRYWVRHEPPPARDTHWGGTPRLGDLRENLLEGNRLSRGTGSDVGGGRSGTRRSLEREQSWRWVNAASPVPSPRLAPTTHHLHHELYLRQHPSVGPHNQQDSPCIRVVLLAPRSCPPLRNTVAPLQISVSHVRQCVAQQRVQLCIELNERGRSATDKNAARGRGGRGGRR